VQQLQRVVANRTIRSELRSAAHGRYACATPINLPHEMEDLAPAGDLERKLYEALDALRDR